MSDKDIYILGISAFYHDSAAAVVVDGDKLGHAALELPQVIRAARDRWGNDVLAADNPATLDRRAIAQRVFRPDEIGKADLAYWESVTHPQIGSQILAELEKLRRNMGWPALAPGCFDALRAVAGAAASTLRPDSGEDDGLVSNTKGH